MAAPALRLRERFVCLGALSWRNAARKCPGAHRPNDVLRGGQEEKTATADAAGATGDADTDPELGPMTHLDVPKTFQGWCTLVSAARQHRSCLPDAVRAAAHIC